MSAPQKLKIYRYIFSLLALLLVSSTCFCQQASNEKKHTKKEAKKRPKKKVEPQPLLRAVTLQVDLGGLATSSWTSTGISSGEASVDVNLRNKWFPVWEFGYASVNHTADGGGQFIGSGIFNRIGFNANLIKTGDNKKIVQSIFYAGLRFGWSSFSYNLNNISISDDYWSTNYSFNEKNIRTTAKWGEIVTGIRVNILKNISLGWSGRLKIGLNTGKSEYTPWYVPGYGITDGSGWGFTYTVGYTIPIK
jgi:hypothetical protein